MTGSAHRGKWRSRYRTLIVMLGVLSVFPGEASGQISPGELSSSHADLEGIANCTKCHEHKGGDAPGNTCVACHGEVGIQIRERGGLHWYFRKTREGSNCMTCHSEHNGREYELVFWEGGMQSFDHDVTGFELEGKHRSLKCRECHRPELVDRDLLELNPKLNLERTFLGLGTACLDCHDDVHRGQLAPSCTDCHGLDAWKPALGFAHDQTRYPLTGEHIDVGCGECHTPVPVGATESTRGDTLTVRYSGFDFGDCRACHRSVHRKELGPRCDGCHSTAGWRNVKVDEFDHSKTAYPLEGRHRALSCDKCHGAGGGREERIEFDACTDCHEDPHGSQFSEAPYFNRCENCHGVERFVPSSYGLAEHEESSYDLTGAHRAVPCIGCHTRDPQTEVVRFKMEFRGCRSCHADEHHGQFDFRTGEDGCGMCHVTENWSRVSFSHDDTRFPLDGKHRNVGCPECHPRVAAPDRTEYTLYRGLPRTCRECHPATENTLKERE